MSDIAIWIGLILGPKVGLGKCRIKRVGPEIRCFFDGKQYLQAKDDTFPAAGKIGLWTKSDAVSYFDDLTGAAAK